MSIAVNARIDANAATLLAMQSQIRAQFKMALFQIQRKDKNLIFEDVIKSGTDPRLSVQVTLKQLVGIITKFKLEHYSHLIEIS